MTMTSRQRVEHALGHRAPDRTPVFEYVLLSPLADKILGRPYAADPVHWPALRREKGWKGAVRQQARDRVDLAFLLGHDLLYVLPNPSAAQDVQASMESCGPLNPDPVESVRQRNQREREVSSLPPDDRFLIYEFLREEMQRRGLDLPILAPAYEHGVWADMALLQTLLLDPEAAHEHFGLATLRSLGWTDKYLQRRIDLIGIGGDVAGNQPLISPKLYREFIAPEVRVVSRRIHQGGARAVNASDGNLWPIIEDFLIGCEVDGYIEIDWQAGMDLRKLKSVYGSRITLLGNLDCGNMLSFGSPEDIRQHTIECLKAGQGNGGHILTAGNAITASVSLRNYLVLVNSYRDFFALPRLGS